ncbi:MAG: hypothetical protein O6913_08825 [Chloroflexi bacterium]|nr:hypothetical protein [Chloroflexota bacterium]
MSGPANVLWTGHRVAMSGEAVVLFVVEIAFRGAQLRPAAP